MVAVVLLHRWSMSLLCSSTGAVRGLMGSFLFLGRVHRYTAWGCPCHQGRRELAPRCSATQLGACIVMIYRQRSSIYTLVRTTTTTTTTHLSHECHPGANPKQQRMQQPNETRGSQ